LPSGGGWSRTAPNVYLSTSTDKVGIGTSVPSFDLSFGGEGSRSIGIEKNSIWLGMGLTVAAGDAATGSTDANGGTLILKGGDSTGAGRSVIRFLTATSSSSGTDTNTSSDVMRIAGPNVGIGTISPLSRLELVGAGTTSATKAFQIRASDATVRVTVLDNGNVGIGTVAPGEKLVVSGAGYFTGANNNNSGPNGGTQGVVVSFGDTSNTGRITSVNWSNAFRDLEILSNNLIFKNDATAPVEVARITAAGYVGIGTSVPGAKLEVFGQLFSRRYAASTSVDWHNGNTQSLTLGNGNNNISFSNGQDGAKYLLILKQPSSGAAGTVTWSTTPRWPGGVAPTLTTTNGRVDYIGFVYNGVDSKYDGIAQAMDLQ
jgi:hypothetical protein